MRVAEADDDTPCMTGIACRCFGASARTSQRTASCVQDRAAASQQRHRQAGTPCQATYLEKDFYLYLPHQRRGEEGDKMLKCQVIVLGSRLVSRDPHHWVGTFPTRFGSFFTSHARFSLLPVFFLGDNNSTYSVLRTEAVENYNFLYCSFSFESGDVPSLSIAEIHRSILLYALSMSTK